MTLLEVQDLNVHFPTVEGTVHASRNISFQLQPGEVLGLVGETGSGKSVIGQAIIRLLPSSAQVSGHIYFSGQDLTGLSESSIHALRGCSISLIPQNPSAALNPVMKNGQQIDEVFETQRTQRKTAVEKSWELLAAVGLVPVERIAREYPHQLSGGMRQRLTTSIAIARGSKLIIADEPTKGLDYHAREITGRLLREISTKKRAALLLITHDLYLAEHICDRIAVLYAGEIVEIGYAEQIFSKPIHPYTQALMKAIPKNGLVPLFGQSPSLMALPEGCAFMDRCERQTEKCHQEHPLLIHENIDGGVRCHHPYCV
jgi:peptide/nickel transport system ATP-binding protein